MSRRLESSVGFWRRQLRSTNTGSMLLKLKPTSERDLSADEVIQELRPKLARVGGVNAYMQNPPVIRVGGQQSKSSYQYTLQDTDQDALRKNAAKLTEALSHVPGFADVTNDMNFNSPSVDVEVDRDQAASRGVSVLPSRRRWRCQFRRRAGFHHLCQRDAEYWVMLELLPQYQNDLNDVGQLYISSNGAGASTNSSAGINPNGATSSTSSAANAAVTALVPLTAVTRMTPGFHAAAVNHLGQLPWR